MNCDIIMDNLKKGRVLRVLDATHYYLQDNQTKNILKVQISSTPQHSAYFYLLKQIIDDQISYELAKKTKMIEQYQKGKIYLNGKDITILYAPSSSELTECTQEKIYEKDQILECYIMKVECLKLKLWILGENKTITFYHSQFSLPKIDQLHPKDVWIRAQDYFKQNLLGQFVQIKINGSEMYHGQLNIHGEILRLSNGDNLKQIFLKDGYAQLSKNAKQYLTEYRVESYNEMVKQAKQERKGIWGEGVKIKSSHHAIDQKYKQWEQWTKNSMSLKEIKNGEQEIRQIGNQMKKHSGSKPDPSKCRILMQAILTILEGCINEKTFVLLQDFCRIVINSLINLQVGLTLQIDSMEFLKYLNKLLIVLIFYMEEGQKINGKKVLADEFDKIVKVIFKCCFIGNQTFHAKIFDKKKDSDFEKFSYDPTTLSGISSFSEQSDYEEADHLSKQAKKQKKFASAQSKVRANSTLLLSLIFKNYSSIVQNHWEICVKSNALTQEFLAYVQTLKITIDQPKMEKEEKKKLANLMRTNFGDLSLIMLVCFEQNTKVKMNALNCMINMIGNFPDRKIIDTTEPSQVQKQLKSTKSSFVPKSFIIFSGLRNALYFLLFSLHHEKNIAIIVNTFKALTQLCQQSTLIDKMGFVEGMGLLMSNYINPVLQFPWNIIELNELKSLCISFLAALVSTQKKWEEMQTHYLMSEAEENVNYCLLIALQDTNSINENVINEILKYFTKLCKMYYTCIFHFITPAKSVWKVLQKRFTKNYNPQFCCFIEQIFKSHFDQITLSKNKTLSQNRSTQEAIILAESYFGGLFNDFLPVYGKVVTIENYLKLLNIITSISYEKWSEAEYNCAKDFLQFCFGSITDSPKHNTYESIQNLKTNSFVRIALIKLLGYMSFCKEFQKSEYSSKAIRSLLNYSHTYKSLNSVVKITWGISNWANIDCFKQGLTEAEMKECLNYMIANSQSDKQKIASNCTRGIGFILKHFSSHEDMEYCISAITSNLTHQILKVRTNSTKTLRAILEKQSQERQYLKVPQLVGLLEQNILKNSYQLQTETLLLIKILGNPIQPNHLLKIYCHILHDLQSHTTMEYQFSEIKALRLLRKTILQEITNFSNQLLENEQASNQIYESILDFILDSNEESARKEAQHSKILERGFEKGEEALNAVFNIRKQQHFDEQKTIKTQFIERGLRYKANQDDLVMLMKIQKVAQGLQQKSKEWKQIASMQIEGEEVSIKQIEGDESQKMEE